MSALNRQPPSKSVSGQAMIEFAICLFVGLIVISALLSFSDIIVKALGLHGTLRAEAGRKALAAPIGKSMAYIKDWNKGQDDTAFTFDDRSVSGGMGLAIVDSIASKSASTDADWIFPSTNTKLLNSILTMHDIPAMPVTFAEAKGSVDVEIGDFAAKHIFGGPEVSVDHSVYMPMCGNLFQ